ncbi:MULTISPECIES: hypothetical protein [Planktothricoides]|nr:MULTISPECIES: hypothetical protein [Planktothricoides]
MASLPRKKSAKNPFAYITAYVKPLAFLKARGVVFVRGSVMAISQ